MKTALFFLFRSPIHRNYGSGMGHRRGGPYLEQRSLLCRDNQSGYTGYRLRADRSWDRFRSELFPAYALYHFASGSWHDDSAHAGTSHCFGKGLVAPLLDFDHGVDTGRSDADVGSIYARRGFPDHRGFLSTYLLPVKNLLKLVRKTADLPGSSLMTEG